MGPLLNKAQLPQGVSAVRPHLEQIDNVPLQVGLFTDANPKATKEMILIMQEYGEIVLVVGSALNTSNAQIFAQSNASICLQPLRDRCHAEGGKTPKIHPNAIDLASRCMGLAVDFHLKHQQLSALPDLISASRHRLYSIRCSLQFLLFLSISLSLIVALSAALFLPIIFKPDQILLFSCLIFPLAALSPLSNSFAPREKFVKIAGKNMDHVNKKEIFASIWTFSIQFLPTVFFTILLYFLLLVRHVNYECEFSDLVCSVGETDGFPNTTVTQLDLSTEQVRHLVAFQLIIATIVHSASWTAPLFSMYHSFPFFKPYWLFTSTLIILIQLIFTKISLGQMPFVFFTTLSTLFLVVWSLLILIINEGRKFKQRRLFMREQRRRKLAFDTKLGMNSPY